MKFILVLVILTISFFGCENNSKIDRVKIDDNVRAQQVKDMKFGMFICWSFSTFSGSEWTPTLD